MEPNSIEIPHGLADITPEWLTEALSDADRGGARVSAIEVERIGDGVGFMGEIARLRLAYDGPAEGAVRSVVAKTPITVPELRHMGLLYGFYEKEHGFYAHFADQIGIDVPRALVNLADHHEGRFVLILEDLQGFRPGDQLDSCSLDEAHDILSRLAALHARWWEHPLLDEHADWLPSPGSTYFEVIRGAYLAQVGTQGAFGALMPDWLNDLVQLNADHYDVLFDLGAGRRPFTLLHGDFRIDNMMFGLPGGDRPFVLLDWQLPMRLNPMFEVVYFVGGSLPVEMRRANEEALIRGYHDGLVAGGVTGYPFEQCWDDYRRTTLGMMGYIVPLVAQLVPEHLNERGIALMTALVSRYVEVIADHRDSPPVRELLAAVG